MEIGERVTKVSGYKYPGIVVSKFLKLDDETHRYVVECTAKQCEGMLHIFSEAQLKSEED